MLIYLLLVYICGCGGTGRRAGLRNQCQRRGGSSPFIRTNKGFLTFQEIEILENLYFFLSVYAKIWNQSDKRRW